MAPQSPTFLTIDEVRELHDDSLAQWGGQAGVRDQGLLESAIAQAAASFGGEFLHSFPFGMAAAYAFHIAENQPFLDGNKRTALAAALAFLEMNDVQLADSPTLTDELADAILGLSNGSGDKKKLTVMFELWAGGPAT